MQQAANQLPPSASGQRVPHVNPALALASEAALGPFGLGSINIETFTQLLRQHAQVNGAGGRWRWVQVGWPTGGSYWRGVRVGAHHVCV